MGPVLSHTPFADLTDVTLADEDTNSILCAIWFADLTDVTLADEDTNSILCAIWWRNLQPMQVAPSGGQIYNQCK